MLLDTCTLIMKAMRIKWKFIAFLILFIIVTFVYINIYGAEEQSLSGARKLQVSYGKNKTQQPKQTKAKQKPHSKRISDPKGPMLRANFLQRHNQSATNDYIKLFIPGIGKNRGLGAMVGSPFGGNPPAIDMTFKKIPPPQNVKRNVDAHMLLTDMMRSEVHDGNAAVFRQYDTLDIQRTGPIPYLPNYKNPCWYERDHPSSTVYLKCLPYALVVGFQKSGTTELHHKLALHPQVVPAHMKEPFYWGHNTQNKTLDQYSNVFSEAAFKILSTVQVNGSSWTHPLVTFEATPSTLYKIPQKSSRRNVMRNITQPYNHALRDIRRLIPNAKIIVTMRNPIDRAFSEFMRIGMNSTRQFHELMETGVSEFKKCLKKLPLRTCVYWPVEAYGGKVPEKAAAWAMPTVGFSIYHVPMQDLLDIFPREQIFFFRLEDLAKHKVGMLQRLFRFLELDPLDNDILRKLLDDPNPNPRDYTLGGMQERTRKLLDDFYAPYNKKLAQLLDDYTVQWKKTLA